MGSNPIWPWVSEFLEFPFDGNGNLLCLPTEHLKSTQEHFQHVSMDSGSNWNLAVLVFEERRGKPEYAEKTSQSKERTTNKLQPHMTPGP